MYVCVTSSVMVVVVLNFVVTVVVCNGGRFGVRKRGVNEEECCSAPLTFSRLACNGRAGGAWRR